MSSSITPFKSFFDSFSQQIFLKHLGFSDTLEVTVIIQILWVRKFRFQQGPKTQPMTHTGVSELVLPPNPHPRPPYI